ncbi:site-2 protease family protein [Jonesiaceae bacterium BS-20]|uniref:Site-2 protease family protein n=1 Tax=Jonesiaceae bacterium BS-20 TaxID=3120821 RepID=A0AAU7DXR9_9MICO
MSYLLGVAIIVLGLLISIGLHEIGHMLPAKKFGVRVPQYMVGFGPTLWSFTRGETEYGIKAIPLGGYVRLVGMYPPGKEGATIKAGFFAQAISGAREASTEEIRPGEEHRAFYNLSMGKKIIVMFGGPFMNLVIAFFLMAVVAVGFGAMTPTTTLGSVSECVIPADAPADASCSDETPAAPGAAANLLPGDTITEWDGQAITDWDQLSALISATGGRTVAVTYLRDGQSQTGEITPVVAQRPVFDELGQPVLDADGKQAYKDKGFVGISPTQELQRQSITVVPDQIGYQLKAVSKIILTLPQRLVDISQAAFGSEERDPNSVVGVVGIGRFAGELASADIAGYTPKLIAADLTSMLAGLNIALFAFNMIPLLPLDGGHIAGAVYEGTRRGVAKLRGKRDPGPADTARMVPVAYVVFALLAGMSLLLIYADIVKPIQFL